MIITCCHLNTLLRHYVGLPSFPTNINLQCILKLHINARNSSVSSAFSTFIHFKTSTLTPTTLFIASSLRDSLLLSSISFRSSFLQQIQLTLIYFALKSILTQNKCSHTLPIKDRFISHWFTKLWFIRHSWFASGLDLIEHTACCRTVEVQQSKHSTLTAIWMDGWMMDRQTDDQSLGVCYWTNIPSMLAEKKWDKD